MTDIRKCIEDQRGIVRPSVMWYWCDRMNPEDIAWQIKNFKDHGIDEFFVHPVWGLECDDYLSDSFMELIRFAVGQAKLNGMNFNIYDEYCWPSGNRACRLMVDYPFTRSTELRYLIRDVHAGEPVTLKFHGEFLSAQMEFSDKLRACRDVTDQVRLTQSGECAQIFYENKTCSSGRFYAFYRAECDGMTAAAIWSSIANYQPGMLDALNPEAFAKFLETNNDRYAEIIGDEFGKTVKRVFTDETGVCSLFDLWNYKDSILPYSIILEDEFEKEHGYPIRREFCALVSPADSDRYVKVRYDYYRTIARLFRDSFLKQYADWCHKDGLILTGHLSGEGNVFYHTTQMGDFFESLSQFDIPGIDSILSKGYVDHPEFGLEAKLLSSVAKFAGKDYAMCETFSGSGWDLSLEDAKRVINKLVMGGVNHIIYMGAFYSLNGGRKSFPIGYAPSHGWNNPLFEHYSALTDYTQARCALSAVTKPNGRILLLMPQFENYVHLNDGEAIDFCWRSAARALTDQNLEYDIFYEPLSEQAAVRGSIFLVGEYEYDVLIVPHMQYSSQKVLDLLQAFASNSGKIVFIGKLPISAADTAAKYDFGRLLDLPGSIVKMSSDSGEYSFYKKDLCAVFHLGCRDGFPAGRFAEDLKQMIGPCMIPFCAREVPDGIRIARRSGRDLDICLVMNDQDVSQSAEIILPGEGSAELLTGVSSVMPLMTFQGAGLRTARLTVAPHDMQIVIVHRDGCRPVGFSSAASKKPDICQETSEEIRLTSGWHFQTAEDNMLPLKLYFAAKTCGEDDNVDLKSLTRLNTQYAAFEFPVESGLTYGDGYVALARFEIADLPDRLELFAELNGGERIYLNGIKVDGFSKTRIWGVRDYLANVAGLVKPGDNLLAVFASVPEWRGPHQMNSMQLRGNFRLDGQVICALSDDIRPEMYTTQGWNYYSGNSFYSTAFELDRKFSRVRLVFETGDVVQVLVNRSDAGILYWKPYELDITDFCKVGRNELELKVTSTYAPTMVIENVKLVSQGMSAYDDTLPVQQAGLRSAPVLTVWQAGE